MNSPLAFSNLVNRTGGIALVTGASTPRDMGNPTRKPGTVGGGVATYLALSGKYQRIITTHSGFEVRDDLYAKFWPQGVERISVQADFRDPARAVQAIVDAVKAQGGTLDVLVHCAGVTETLELVSDPLTERERTVPTDKLLEALRRSMDINAYGAVALTLALLPALRKGRHPHVAFIGTNHVDSGASGGHLAYAMSKAALQQAIPTLVHALNKNCSGKIPPNGDGHVLLTSIVPGWVDGNRHRDAQELFRETGGQKGYDIDAATRCLFTGHVCQPEDIGQAVDALDTNRNSCGLPSWTQTNGADCYFRGFVE